MAVHADEGTRAAIGEPSAKSSTANNAITAQRDAIRRFVVLLQSQTTGGRVTEQIAAAIQSSLSGTIAADLTYVGPHQSGGQIVELTQPVGLAEAKRLVGLLRMRPDVIWAELDPAERETIATTAKRAERLANISDVAQLMVMLSDPETQRMSRADDKLSPTWDELLSQAAGVPLRVLRATVGGAWIVALPRSMSYNDAASIGKALTDSGVATYADPDAPLDVAFVPNDPFFPQAQWSFYDPVSSPYVGIDTPHAWDISTGDPNIVIAVVDTGVLPHPQIANRLLQGYDFVSNPANSRDGLGPHASGIDPGNWHSSTDCPGKPAAPSNWHGTHVSGIIAATGNDGVDSAGINWQSKILPVRVLGTCGGNTSDILAGMLWAAGLPVPGVPNNPTPARVINMSLGGAGTCTAQYQALVNQVLATGALIVASAGNDDGIADNQIPGACFGLSTVGATGPYGDRAPYSNFSFTLDISAPGGDSTFGTGGEIYSTLNAGTTTPAGYIYKAYQGTSQAAPHISGVASLMLAVNPSLTPAQLKQIMADTATGFAAGSICDLTICGAGIVNAYRAVFASKALALGPNYQGLWWGAPAGFESGWGINFAHQGNVIFATWFTYASNGRDWWLVMTAGQTGAGTFSGTIYQTKGPVFDSVPFNPAAVAATPVGTGTITFYGANNGSFAYTVNGVSQTKVITRQVFGTLPICGFGIQPNLSATYNYQDLWWKSPAGSESGWGINLTHQGNIIFATWFTYDLDSAPLWLVATAPNVGPGTYSGTVYVTSGPAFNSVPFNPLNVTATAVGTMTLTFTDGNSGTLSYNIQGKIQSKSITRQVFRAPGTMCQ